MVESDWIAYKCKSGQTVFFYNKETGVHKWPPGYNDGLSEDRIIFGEPVLARELSSIATQTDDYGCTNGCTSMTINTVPVCETSLQPEPDPTVDHEKVLISIYEQKVDFINVDEQDNSELESTAVCSTAHDSSTVSDTVCQPEKTISVPVNNQHDTKSENKLEQSQDVDETPVCSTAHDASTCTVSDTVRQPEQTISVPVNNQHDTKSENKLEQSQDVDETPVCSTAHDASTCTVSDTVRQPEQTISVPVNNQHDTKSENELEQSQDVDETPISTHTYIGLESTAVCSTAHDTSDTVCQPQQTISVPVNNQHNIKSENEPEQSQDVDETPISEMEFPPVDNLVLKLDSPIHVYANVDNQKDFHQLENVMLRSGDTCTFTDLNCPYCSKEFKFRSLLLSHLRVHTHEKPFKCSICDKKFSQKAYLKIHFRTHTKEKPYKCSLCDKRYAQMSNMQTHMRIHAGGKPFECTFCKKAFVLKAHLSIHLRTHTKEKPFQCCLCEKSFSQQGNYDSHLKIHSGERPYQCRFCGKAFSLKQYHDVHIRTHLGIKPYECSKCGKKFTQQSNLKAHTRNHHKTSLYDGSCVLKHK